MAVDPADGVGGEDEAVGDCDGATAAAFSQRHGLHKRARIGETVPVGSSMSAGMISKANAERAAAVRGGRARRWRGSGGTATALPCQQYLVQQRPETVRRQFRHALQPSAAFQITALAPDLRLDGAADCAIGTVASDFGASIRSDDGPAQRDGQVQRPGVVGEHRRRPVPARRPAAAAWSGRSDRTTGPADGCRQSGATRPLRRGRRRTRPCRRSSPAPLDQRGEMLRRPALGQPA